MNSSEKGVSFLETWNRDRSLRQGCIGGLLLGPSLHFFFTRIVPRVTYPARSAGFNVFMRVAAQQACMMPLFQFNCLFTSGFLEPANNFRERIDHGCCRFKEKWRKGFATSLIYWPTVNVFMYGLVQPKFFNLYADLAGIFFAAVMSYIAYSSENCPTCEPEVIN